MIKCDTCGNKISLETLRCPNCKQINKIAEEHYKELAAYDRKYKLALKSVYRQTKEYRGYILRILLAGILICIAFFAFAFSKSPDDMIEDIFHPRNTAYISSHNSYKDELLKEYKYETYESLCKKEGYLVGENDHKVIDAVVGNFYAIANTFIEISSMDPDRNERYLSTHSDSIASGIFYFKQEQEILELYRKANQAGTTVDDKDVDKIRAAFSNMPMPSDEALALQLKTLDQIKLRILELMSYELHITMADAQRIWDMDRSNARLSIENQIKEVYLND